MKRFTKNLRKNQTDAERKIWRCLKNRAMAGFKFRRQCPIGPYIVDFVCLEKMVVIEIDGGQHADQLKKDARRTAYIKSRSFEVLRFWNNEVLVDTDSVLSTILTALVNSPLSPTLLPQGEGCKETHTQSVIGVDKTENEYSPLPTGEGGVREGL